MQDTVMLLPISEPKRLMQQNMNLWASRLHKFANHPLLDAKTRPMPAQRKDARMAERVVRADKGDP